MTFGKFETGEEVAAREARALAEKVRVGRLKLARANRDWTELEEVDLVRRGPSLLVAASTDQVFRLRRGHVFGPRSANVEFLDESTTMHWFEDRAGCVVFLERVDNPRSWSAAVAKNPRLAVVR